MRYAKKLVLNVKLMFVVNLGRYSSIPFSLIGQKTPNSGNKESSKIYFLQYSLSLDYKWPQVQVDPKMIS